MEFAKKNFQFFFQVEGWLVLRRMTTVFTHVLTVVKGTI